MRLPLRGLPWLWALAACVGGNTAISAEPTHAPTAADPDLAPEPAVTAFFRSVGVEMPEVVTPLEGEPDDPAAPPSEPPVGSGQESGSEEPSSGESSSAYLANARAHVGRTYHGEIQACFRAAALRNPDIEGRLVVTLVLQPNGDIGSARADGAAIGDPALEDCVELAARDWELPPPPPGTFALSFSLSI